MITVDRRGNIVNKDEFELDEAISEDSRNNIITAVTASGQTIQVFNGVVSLGGEVFPKVDNTPDEPVQELANSLPEGASSCSLPESLPGVYLTNPGGNMVIVGDTDSGTFSVTIGQILAVSSVQTVSSKSYYSCLVSCMVVEKSEMVHNF